MKSFLSCVTASQIPYRYRTDSVTVLSVVEEKLLTKYISKYSLYKLKTHCYTLLTIEY